MLKKAGKINTTYIEGEKIPSIRYQIFQNIPFIKDGFSTRLGGVSQGQFQSMNFSVKMGDTTENVRENFRIFTEAHGFSNPVMTDQTHTVNVKRIFSGDAGKNIYVPKDYSDIDGFVTNEPGITLVTTFADCVPLYFVDEVHKAIGLAHSGWKGTIGRIGQHTIEHMKKEFGTNPRDIKAAIGPSICANCYEVSRELAEDFATEFHCRIKQTELPITIQNMDEIVYKKSEKYYLNLWAANFHVLLESGVLTDQIAIPDICTCCNQEVLFSHRASKGKRGNLCAFLMIEE
ncbi:MAG: peptidoglycan editing factor PgeF [Lachnospiraceae bacterium]|nr:peptidoglycan editing factor PgeF [Lachnospiraceae bacterium]